MYDKWKNEVKVLFYEGEKLRVIRGVICEEDDTFLVLQRRDGKIRINKVHIVKVEEWK